MSRLYKLIDVDVDIDIDMDKVEHMIMVLIDSIPSNATVIVILKIEKIIQII